MERYDDLTRQVIGCAIEVHRTLGPGLLESVYEACLSRELTGAGLTHHRQQKLAVSYKGHLLDCDLTVDLIVERVLVVEVKSVPQVLPVHEAQLLTYMRIGALPVGILLNFNSAVLKQGIRRRVLAENVGNRFQITPDSFSRASSAEFLPSSPP